jgi:hypothetical protein
MNARKAKGLKRSLHELGCLPAYRGWRITAPFGNTSMKTFSGLPNSVEDNT